MPRFNLDSFNYNPLTNRSNAAIDSAMRNVDQVDARLWERRSSNPKPQSRKSTKRRGAGYRKRNIQQPKPVAGDSVTVQAGDSLSAILKRTTGSYKNVAEVAKLNGIKDPNKIYVGQKIKIPGYKADVASKPAADSVKPADVKPAAAAAATSAVKDSVAAPRDTTAIVRNDSIPAAPRDSVATVTPTDSTSESGYERARAHAMQLLREREASRRQYQNSIREDRKDYYRNILSRYNKLPGETNPQWVARAERLDRMSKMSGAVETAWPETYVMGGGAGAKVVRSALGAYRTLEQRPRTINVKRMAEAKRKADNAATTQKYDNVINITSGRRSTRRPEPVEVKPAATQAKPKVQEPVTPAEEVQDSRFNWITRMQAGARLGRMRTKNVVTNARQKAIERLNRLRQTKGKESKPTESKPIEQPKSKTSKTKSRKEKIRGNENKNTFRQAQRAKRNANSSTITL